MAKKCAFCGKDLGLFQRQELQCGYVYQTVCEECKKTYGSRPTREWVQYLLDFGAPEEPERLREYLSTPEERARKAREAKKSGLTCLRCGGEMLKCGRRSIPLGAESLFGTVLRDGLMTSWMELDVLRCEQCGRAEFFLPEPPPEGELEREETVVCPVCGKEYPAGTACPRCALNRGLERRRSSGVPREERQREKKPPWEK